MKARSEAPALLSAGHVAAPGIRDEILDDVPHRDRQPAAS